MGWILAGGVPDGTRDDTTEKLVHDDLLVSAAFRVGLNFIVRLPIKKTRLLSLTYIFFGKTVSTGNLNIDISVTLSV